MSEEKDNLFSNDSSLESDSAALEAAIGSSDGRIGSGGGTVPLQKTPDSKHKVACFFHVFFKATALVVYLLGHWVTSNFIIQFVVCILLLSFDFWTVKNITGRLLVGLRWWNLIKEDGSNEWKFEAAPDNRYIHPYDSFVFWTFLYITPVIWGIFGFVILVTISNWAWLPVVAVAIALSGANVVNYWRCQRDAPSQLATIQIAQRILSSAASVQSATASR